MDPLAYLLKPLQTYRLTVTFTEREDPEAVRMARAIADSEQLKIISLERETIAWLPISHETESDTNG